MRARLIAKFWNPKEIVWAATGYAKRFPEAQNGQTLLAWVYYQLRQPQKALQHIEKAEKLGKTTQYTRLLRMDCQEMEADPEGFCLRLDTSVSEFSIAYGFRQQISTATSELEMLEAARAAEDAGEPRPLVVVHVATWYSSKGDYKAAMERLMEASKEFPDDYALLIKIGGTHLLLGEEEKGLEVFEQAVDRNPVDSRLASWLVARLKRKHRYFKAIRVLNKTALAQARISRIGY